MATYYRITSSAGVDRGTYQADTEQAALDSMARDAGYRDQAHAEEVAGAFDGDVVEVGSQESMEEDIYREDHDARDPYCGRRGSESGR